MKKNFCLQQFQTPDQSYLNALQYLSPAAGYPFGALGTLPFDLTNALNMRDTQSLGNGTVHFIVFFILVKTYASNVFLTFISLSCSIFYVVCSISKCT